MLPRMENKAPAVGPNRKPSEKAMPMAAYGITIVSLKMHTYSTQMDTMNYLRSSCPSNCTAIVSIVCTCACVCTHAPVYLFVLLL